jgi:HK97 family phage prohead protease
MTAELISRFLAIDDFEIKRVDRKGRMVTAYAAVFDIEAEISDKHGHYWEKINRAAYNRTLSHGIQRVQVFYNHGYDLSGKPNMLGAIPVATPQDITPDGKGLLTRSLYGDGDLPDALLDAWADGRIKGQSFTGRVYQSKTVGKSGGIPVIERTELGLKEYGPTHSPAYLGAGLVAIRSQEDLSELVRSMITDMVGTPSGDSSTIIGTPAPGSAAPEGSPDGHPDRNKVKARRAYNLLRARDMGVVKDATS